VAPVSAWRRLTLACDPSSHPFYPHLVPRWVLARRSLSPLAACLLAWRSTGGRVSGCVVVVSALLAAPSKRCATLARCSRSSVLSTASMPLTCAAAMHARDLNF
jgi:hypothetical protein